MLLVGAGPGLLRADAGALDAGADAALRRETPNADPLFHPRDAGFFSRADLVSPMCLPNGWAAFVKRNEDDDTIPNELVFTRWGTSAPKPLCRIPGWVNGTAVGLRAKSAVAFVARAFWIQTGREPATLWLIDERGCRQVKSKGAALRCNTGVVASPAGDFAAVTDFRSIVSVNLASGAVKRQQLVSLGDVAPVTWDDDGPVASHDVDGALHRPDAGRLEAPYWRSPDGRHRVTRAEASRLHIQDLVADGGARDFNAELPSQRSALADLTTGGVRWVGPRGLLLEADSETVLDLASLEVRDVTPAGYAVVCSSPDGQHALLEGPEGWVEGVR